jgi:hypothetical protein
MVLGAALGDDGRAASAAAASPVKNTDPSARAVVPLVALFDVLDADGSGFLERAELRRWLAALARFAAAMHAADPADSLKDSDSEGNRKVKAAADPAEAPWFAGEQWRDYAGVMAGAGANIRGMGWQIGQLCDTGGDGRVSRKEFEAAVGHVRKFPDEIL